MSGPWSHMIEINGIYGNINFDQVLKSKHLEMAKNGKAESILLTRNESEKSRMRKVSDKGTEIALIMPPGSCLNDGDVILLDDQRMIIVKQKSESVALVTMLHNNSNENLLETAVKIGHIIGNLHRPIRVKGNRIYFPIQALSEIELFEKLFANLRDLEIKSDEMVFQAERECNIYEH
jgi:urease accessory protein